MLSRIAVPLCATLAVAVICPSNPQTNWSIDPPPRYLITFGDSYSQTGFNISLTKPSTNNPFGNPAFPGYTTVNNGINWVGEAGVVLAPNNTLVYNFAYGGATVNASLAAPYLPTVLSFIDQVTQFSQSIGRINSLGFHAPYAMWNATNSAFGIWFGVNDIGNSWYLNNPSYSQRNQQIFDSLFGQVDILYKSGARRFVFLNAPPTDRTPTFIESGSSTVAGVAADIADWNSALISRATQWAASNPGVTYEIVDTHSYFTTLLDNPTRYGAPNATCYDSSATKCLWWNNYHPGAAINQGVGRLVSLSLERLGFYDNGVW